MKRILMGSLFVLSMATVGCGYDGHSACDDMCDCEGCNDQKRNDCYDLADRTANDADHRGCNDQYDALISCIDDTQYCDSRGNWSTDCGAETERLTRCIG